MDGGVVGSVPGRARSFDAHQLAPDTVYYFRLIAFRGRRHSVSSVPLTASTLKPALSAAILAGDATVHSKVITSSIHELTYTVGKSWTTDWSFTPNCGLVGPCTSSLSGDISGFPFNMKLAASDSTYSGKTRIPHLEWCDFADAGESYPIRSVVEIKMRIKSAGVFDKRWKATYWVGTMTIHNSYTSAGSIYCSPYSWTASVRGSS